MRNVVDGPLLIASPTGAVCPTVQRLDAAKHSMRESRPPPAQDGISPKRRKKSKNKFKPQAAEPAASAPQPQRSLHATTSGAVEKKKKKKRGKQQQGSSIDETVAVQADAPGALQPAAAARWAPAAALTATAAGAQPGRRSSLLLPPGGKRGKGGSLLEQMRARLQGGHFRWLNEALYTTDGAAALEMMQRQPELMEQYHQGFREQTKGWPVQPVDHAIRWLRGRPPSWVVADMGCGDARIAATAAQKVHSFDLTATAPGVVACNMADVPLPDTSVDAAIFCLSLMGTDYGTFLTEAARILKPAGWLWIAEVQSRFVDAAGSSVLPAFLAALGKLGFGLKRKDLSNSHFLVLELQRQQQRGSGSEPQAQWPELRACQYKKR